MIVCSARATHLKTAFIRTQYIHTVSTTGLDRPPPRIGSASFKRRMVRPPHRTLPFPVFGLNPVGPVAALNTGAGPAHFTFHIPFSFCSPPSPLAA